MVPACSLTLEPHGKQDRAEAEYLPQNCMMAPVAHDSSSQVSFHRNSQEYTWNINAITIILVPEMNTVFFVFVFAYK